MITYQRLYDEEIEILTKYVYPLYWRLVKNFYYYHAASCDIEKRERCINTYLMIGDTTIYELPIRSFKSLDIFLTEIAYFDQTDADRPMMFGGKTISECTAFIDKLRYILEYYHSDYFESQSTSIIVEDFQKVIWEPLIDILTLWKKI